MPNEEGEVVNNEEVMQETPAPEPTPEEPKEPEVAEPTEEPEGEEAVEDSEEKPQKGAEKRKEQLKEEIDELEQQVEEPSEKANPNQEIRDLVARRNELRDRVKQSNEQVYRPATEDQLLDQINPDTGTYYSRLEAKLAAMEQSQQIDRYNNEIADTQLTLSNEAQRALQDFPMFDEQSPEYNKEVAAQVDGILGKSLVIDPNTNQVIGSHVSPYELYKAVAVSAQTSAVKGQVAAQKATEKMLANADTPSGAQQSEKSFNQLSTEEMAAKLRAKGHDI